ncbi:MAG: YicC/YloC family endoribonuclease [Bacillota bacterium]|nr:YicC/YloC family endoribonuclease [Bacillota bacterium]
MSIRSMTGFGRVSGETALGSLTVEMKSVNHRYLDISLRLPRDLAALEEDIKAWIRDIISRGRIEVNLRLQTGTSKNGGVVFSHSEVKSYVSKLQSLAADTGLSFEIRLEHLLTLPGVQIEPEVIVDEQDVTEQVKEIVKNAAVSLLVSREVEGTKLAEDLKMRFCIIEKLVDGIEGRAGLSVEAYRQRLSDNVVRILSSFNVEPARLEQEVVLFAERSSITEELVRLRTHTHSFAQFLGAHDAIGRKMDFYVQEMNREVNTIGSKSADVGISQMVVEIKSELEKIREQVQNIE